jgi:hypothetical protein
VGHLAGFVGLVVAVVAATAMSFAERAPSPIPTAAAEPGQCHRAEDPNELIAMLSDTAPPVPCSRPHQTETMWVSRVTGPLAASKTRPNGELLNQTISGQCYDYDSVRTYLGAGPADVTWGILSWARFPTAEEWARGDRTLVCEGSAQADTPTGPTIDFPLAGVMSTRHSGRFRLCWSATSRNVSCDRPHVKELVGPTPIELPPGPWPGEAGVADMAAGACRPVADDYLGQPISTRPDLVVQGVPPGEAAWGKGNRPAECWIGNADGRSTTDTLRGGLG